MKTFPASVRSKRIRKIQTIASNYIATTALYQCKYRFFAQNNPPIASGV